MPGPQWVLRNCSFEWKSTRRACDQELLSMDFPGGPAVKSPSFQCRGRVFNPWDRELRYHMLCGMAKKKLKINSYLVWWEDGGQGGRNSQGLVSGGWQGALLSKSGPGERRSRGGQREAEDSRNKGRSLDFTRCAEPSLAEGGN